MKYIIFYSWQSDLPNKTNRGFIESVIKYAIKDIRNNEEYELEPSIDRDTQGVPGAPNIIQAILDKIKTCDAFVADISIVTGDKASGQRPSPNPNVLLELGYAIALLGWEKIILFCNEAYGTGEDLPFDIRQHRRIPYRLLEDDTNKSEIRIKLAVHFKGRLVELLQKGKSASYTKQPYISVSWNYLNIQEANDSNSGVDSKTIVLHRICDISRVKDKVEREIIVAKSIDGSIDPKWGEKLDNYITKANEFISNLNDETKKLNYLIDSNAGKTYPITLSVKNDGNATASDIRTEIPIPEWLLAFEEFPNKKDVPIKPNVPSPILSRIGSALAAIGKITDLSNMITKLGPALSEINIRRNINRTSACYPRENYIYFWADRLLHKNVITNRSDRFYLMAKPNAPKGEVTLKGKVFCSEYDDWQEIELVINIV